MFRKLVPAVLVALLVCASSAPGSARAQTQDQIARAKTHFEAGRALYNLGNYSDAVREFLAGYELVPRREFLLNIAQTYRKLRNFARARAMYEKYLAEAPADDPRRDSVRKNLAEVTELAAREPAPTPTANDPGTAGSGASDGTQSTAGSTPSADASATVAAGQDAQPQRESFVKRHKWFVPVVVGVVVVGVGLGVGLGLGLKPDPCEGNTIGCLDATKSAATASSLVVLRY